MPPLHSVRYQEVTTLTSTGPNDRVDAWRAQRRRWMIIRIVMLVGIVVIGATLHHKGTTYDVIRVAYFALVIGFLVYRMNARGGMGGRGGGFGRGRGFPQNGPYPQNAPSPQGTAYPPAPPNAPGPTSAGTAYPSSPPDPPGAIGAVPPPAEPS
jgi:hypothetical protein